MQSEGGSSALILLLCLSQDPRSRITFVLHFFFFSLTDVPTGTQHLILYIKQVHTHKDVHTQIQICIFFSSDF